MRRRVSSATLFFPLLLAQSATGFVKGGSGRNRRCEQSPPASLFTYANTASAAGSQNDLESREALSPSAGRPNPLVAAGADSSLGSPVGRKNCSSPSSALSAPVPKAPLVDSTLLRFLSAQKMDIVLPPSNSAEADEEASREGAVDDNAGVQQRQRSIAPASNDDDDTDNDLSSDVSAATTLNSTTTSSNIDPKGRENTALNTAPAATSEHFNAQPAQGAQIKGTVGQQVEGETVPGKVVPKSLDTAYANTACLGQYNAQRISQQLVSIGADEDASIEAGRIVQRYALARMMRRSVRWFLRERDLMWANGTLPAQSPPQLVPFETVDEGEVPCAAADQQGSEIDAVIQLLTDAGLTGKDVAAIFSHTPSVATMFAGAQGTDETLTTDENSPSSVSRGNTLKETLDRAYFSLLRGTLKLRKYDARKVLRMCPGLLTKRGSKSAEDVVTLMSSLGVSTSSLAREKKTLPLLLSRSPAAIFRLVAFLSSGNIRMSTKRIGSFIRRPDSSALLDAVAPVASLNRLDPAILSEDVTFAEVFCDDRIDPRQGVDEPYRIMAAAAATLCCNIGVRDLASMVSAWPGVLLLDVSEVLPIAEYLHQIGMDKEDVPMVLQSYPALIEADIAKLRQVVTYMQSLGVADESLGGILRAFPSLFSLDVEKDMVPVVSFLREIGVVNIGRFITRLPPVLGYSVEKELVPKWKFLTQVCQFDYFEVVRFPAYFSYPLERVIKTRYEYLRDVKRVPISLVSVDDVLRFGDVDFAVAIAGDKDGGSAFVAYANKRKELKSLGKKRHKVRTYCKKIGRTKQQL